MFLVWPSRLSALFLGWMGFCLWALMTLNWTPVPSAGTRAALSLLAIGLGSIFCVRCLGSLANPPGKHRVVTILSMAMFVQAAVIILEALSGGFILPLINATIQKKNITFSNLNSGVNLGLLLTWVLIMGAFDQGRRRLAGALIIGMVLLVGLSNSESAKVALILAVAASGATLLLGRWALRLVIWGYALFLTVTPFVFSRILTDSLFREIAPHLPFSFQHRFIIWRHVSDWIMEHPFLGWGVSASRSFQDERKMLDIFQQEEGWVQKSIQIMPIHPHNASLQIWLDLGVVGLVLAVLVLFLFLAVLERRQRTRWHQAGVTGLITGGLLLTVGAYSIWQGWLLTCGVLVGCLGWMILRNEGGSSLAPESGGTTRVISTAGG
ncbi:O-antigen ligase family protein [Rhodospirillum sp. A1_3_36]|uniref:O-antigen ligase family protein n=1 Tax=Rhodospirillum sp. A1_3_36 TaxID=3391666 RepID=UPI0039A7581D